MNFDFTIEPLAADCEALRQSLLANPLPPVWQLDPAEARRLHIELSATARPGWTPPLDDLPVSVEDLAPVDGLPAMRRYRATGSSSTTCLVWLHGGGWVLGNLATTDATARTACDATGWDVLSVDYRCAPVDPFPAAVLDCLAAADWAVERYERVIIGGDSAGGNLAAVVARERAGQLVGQVLIYPVTDPTMATVSFDAFVDRPFLSRRDMEWFYDQYAPVASDRTSPLIDLLGTGADSDTVPVPALVFTVGHDPLRDEGIAYAKMLADAGGEVVWIHAPELYHGAFSQSGFLPSAEARVGEVWPAAHRLLS